MSNLFEHCRGEVSKTKSKIRKVETSFAIDDKKQIRIRLTRRRAGISPDADAKNGDAARRSRDSQESTGGAAREQTGRKSGEYDPQHGKIRIFCYFCRKLYKR